MSETKYIPPEEWSAEWLQTTPIDRPKITKLVNDFYKKYAEEKEDVPVIFVDNPLDAILTMSSAVNKAYEKLEETLHFDIAMPGHDELVPLDVGMRWPYDFKERLVNQMHVTPYSIGEALDYKERESIMKAPSAGLADNVQNMVSAWVSTWRRWTEYPRGWEMIKEHDLHGIWGDVRRWSFYWNPVRGVFNMPIIGQVEMELLKKEKLQDAYEIAKEGFLYFPFELYCIVVERPTAIYTNEEGTLLSRLDGPALEFSGDAGIWAVNGVMVPREALDGRGLTAAKIDNTANVEARRVLIEAYGQDKWLRDSGGEMIQSDGYGELWKRPQRRREEEDVVMVKVVNSTPEPDGHYKDYWLRVPPDMETAEQAVAWTFNFSKGRYAPRLET